jgi:uncharacterized protein (TIGR02246 family)
MEPEIEAVNCDYSAAYNAGDIEALLRFLTDDAMTLSPDQAPVCGRAAHRDYFEAAFRREPRRQLALATIRSEHFGDVLYDAGTWTNTVTAADGSEHSARGYYLGVYRKEQGSWKVVATTFNIAM